MTIVKNAYLESYQWQINLPLLHKICESYSVNQMEKKKKKTGKQAIHRLTANGHPPVRSARNRCCVSSINLRPLPSNVFGPISLIS
jgi:hypothetical protein